MTSSVGGVGKVGRDGSDRIPRRWQRAVTADTKKQKDLAMKNNNKYNYLKFVERQKVERKLKSCRRLLAEALGFGRTAEAKTLRAQLESHERDMDYVAHYPRHLPYNALFPSQDSDLSKQRREKVRAMIRDQLENQGPQGYASGQKKVGKKNTGSAGKTGEVDADFFEPGQAAGTSAKEKRGRRSKGETEVQSPDPAHTRRKKRKVQAADASAKRKNDSRGEGEAEAPDPVFMKKKKMKRKAQALERLAPGRRGKTEVDESAPAPEPGEKKRKTHKASVDDPAPAPEPGRKKRRKQKADGESGAPEETERMAQSVKSRGSLVEGQGTRAVFQSDDED